MKRPGTPPPSDTGKPARKVRIGDVAASAGVSVGTVSNVINGRGNVSAKRRALVEKAIKELSFSGSLLAKGMRNQRFPVVGLCVPNATSSNFVMMSDAIEALAAAAEYELVQVITRHDPARELARIDRLIASRASGVMVLPTGQADRLIDRLTASDMPTVAINHFGGAQGVDHVRVDHRSAFREAARQLVAGGYDELIVASQFPGFAVVQENIAGIHEGVAAAGRAAKVTVFKAGATPLTYQETVGPLLQARTGRAAVIASSSLLAAWSIEAFRALGLSMPEDIGLLCAEEPNWAQALWPRLSCIQQPTRDLAEAAWRLLHARINGSDDPPETVICAPAVNIRESLRLGNGGGS